MSNPFKRFVDYVIDRGGDRGATDSQAEGPKDACSLKANSAIPKRAERTKPTRSTTATSAAQVAPTSTRGAAMSEPTQREIEIAKRILTATGHVVLKAASNAKAQERQRAAEFLANDAREQAASQDAWWREHVLPELFSYRDRVTFLYGAARAAGCSAEELVGQVLTEPQEGQGDE